MENKKILAAVSLSTLLVLSLFMVSNISNEDKEQVSSTDYNYSDEVKTTSEGVKYTIHPDELLQGCPGMDCIPSIDDPSFEDSEEADWLEQDDRVIGLEINNDTRAYPLRILSRHEIVNDKVGGEPVAVTYCPLCRSGVTYSRKVKGEVLEFGVSGKLHDANLVMYDRETETYWNQIFGEAIVGEKVPQELELIYSSITTWGEWKEGHPDTKVLSRNTGIYPVGTYDTSAYQGYRNSQGVGFGVDEVDGRLPAKNLVYGIKVRNESKAYPENSVSDQSLIQDEINNRTVLVFERPDDGTVTALVTEDQGREFTLASGSIQSSTGGEWSFNGDQMNGDGSMRQVIPQGFYWFAWSKFNPETQVYGK